ncbi:MAG: dipeptidase [Proteobacteria bacterium]|nr:dipeptidase [Pseudomonadota bacterium]
MKLRWHDLGGPRADRADGRQVDLAGYPVAFLPAASTDQFLMMAEPGCCAGCVPANPLAVVEVTMRTPLRLRGEALRLSGTWQVVTEPGGARYRLVDAAPVAGLGRRALMAASPLFCLPAGAALAQAADGTAVDIHSHAGNLILATYGRATFSAVAAPMRQGGVSAICLAMVADSPVIQTTGGRIRPVREPRPGELASFGQTAFGQLHALVRDQGLALVRSAADLRAAHASRPSVIVAAEGADFLEGRIERLDDAWQRWGLRHLQLTHYRVNELGDIQTEPSTQGGLTAFGAEVIRRCNQLGIVVDVAHGTYELVQKAAAVTSKPLVLSHTSLTERPAAWTRRILPYHAKAVADTGGVIGLWPPTAFFPSLDAFVTGFARLVEIVGIDHVGLGTDMLGLGSPSIVPGYAEVATLAAALRTRFNAEETAKLLGGNYRRVFLATVP